MNWKAYNELAWVEHILAPPETKLKIGTHPIFLDN